MTVAPRITRIGFPIGFGARRVSGVMLPMMVPGSHCGLMVVHWAYRGDNGRHSLEWDAECERKGNEQPNHCLNRKTASRVVLSCFVRLPAARNCAHRLPGAD
jgi:hypothetical protein